jgi:hypothetical protein
METNQTHMRAKEAHNYFILFWNGKLIIMMIFVSGMGRWAPRFIISKLADDATLLSNQ